jgi:diguanylate cyclase (GGDEF)-like protein
VSILPMLAATAAIGLVVGRLSARTKLRTLRAETQCLRRAVRTLEGLLRAAEHDALTGLPNRLRAANLFTVRQLLGRPTVVALIDLDRFKNVNDTYGHHVGDDVLRAVAGRLARHAQANHGIAARFGGDEFLLLLPAEGDDHVGLVQQALDILSEQVVVRTHDGDVAVIPKASAGIAVHDGAYGTFQMVLEHADIALYHAKQTRGTHRLHSPEMRMPSNAARHGPRRRDAHRTHGSHRSSGEVAS